MSKNSTDEQNDATIAALTAELVHYERHGMDDRADQVRAELGRLAADAAPPAKRASKRASKSRKKSTSL
jgi:hypothetical protein